MHIPENYLSPETCAVMAAAMVPVWYKSVKQVRETVPKDKMPLLGTCPEAQRVTRSEVRSSHSC